MSQSRTANFISSICRWGFSAAVSIVAVLAFKGAFQIRFVGLYDDLISCVTGGAVIAIAGIAWDALADLSRFQRTSCGGYEAMWLRRHRAIQQAMRDEDGP